MDLDDSTAAPPSVRDRILWRFREWLDEALAEEAPPAGIAAEVLAEIEGRGEPVAGGTDLHALWSGMIALTQEVKLQGRAFHQLSEALAPMGELQGRVDESLVAHEDGLAEMRRVSEEAREDHEERQRRALADAALHAWRKVIDVLLDMRERLDRAVSTAAEVVAVPAPVPRAWWARLAGRSAPPAPNAAAVALLEGNRLALARLDEALEGIDVCEIECKARPFDPHRMKAVELGEAPGVPDGQVLAVRRRGYEWHGELLRAAEVMVSRAGAPRAKEGNDGRE